MSKNYKIYFDNLLKISSLSSNLFFATLQYAERQIYKPLLNKRKSAKLPFLTFVTKNNTVKMLYNSDLAKLRFLLQNRNKTNKLNINNLNY